MVILVLLVMYFDAVVVFVTSQTLLFRLVLAILCPYSFMLRYSKITVCLRAALQEKKREKK